MGTVHYLRDSFVNWLAGLGVPGKDKRTGAGFQFIPLTPDQLQVLYRDSWLAGKIVDIPADDATREWRSWQAKPNQIENLEAVEKNFDVQRKIRDAKVLSRLFGGSIIVMGVDGQGDSSQLLNLEKVKKDDLKFIHVAAPMAVGTGPLITDVMDPFYGYPQYFTRNIQGTSGTPVVSKGPFPTSELIRGEPGSKSSNIGDLFRIHPSRVILLRGRGLPDPTIWSTGAPWGDSVLQRIEEAINDSTSVFASAAALVNEAKLDVIKIPGLNRLIVTDDYKHRLTERFTFANAAKSNINAIVIDKEEDWARVTSNFGGLPEIMQMFMLVVSGAADIPVTRLLGQSPAGLSATGESDIRNYYDHVAAEQENDLTPTLNRLDEVLIRSALGQRDPSIYYEWNPLWQITDAEKAAISVQKANAFKVDHDAGLIDPEALRIGRQNQLIEDGVYPGLEQALEEQALLELESMKTPEEQDQEALQSGDPSLPPVSPGAATAASNVINLAKKKAGGVSDLSPFDDAMMWDPGEHPRNASGPGGGQFASKGGGGRGKKLTEKEKVALVAQMTPQQMVAEYKKQTGKTKDPTEKELAEFFGLSGSKTKSEESGPVVLKSYPKNEGKPLLEKYSAGQELVIPYEGKPHVYSMNEQGFLHYERPFKEGGKAALKTDTPASEFKSLDDGFDIDKADLESADAPKSFTRIAQKQPDPFTSDDAIMGLDQYGGAYQEDGGAFSVNQALRGEKKKSAADKKTIAGLDALMKNTSLPADLVVYRGMDAKSWKKFSTLKAGDEFDDAGFVSTSARSSVAGGFQSGQLVTGEGEETPKAKPGGGQLEILVGKGAKAFMISDDYREGMAWQAEVLLNRGTKFRVESVKDSKIQVRVIG